MSSCIIRFVVMKWLIIEIIWGRPIILVPYRIGRGKDYGRPGITVAAGILARSTGAHGNLVAVTSRARWQMVIPIIKQIVMTIVQVMTSNRNNNWLFYKAWWYKKKVDSCRISQYLSYHKNVMSRKKFQWLLSRTVYLGHNYSAKSYWLKSP